MGAQKYTIIYHRQQVNTLKFTSPEDIIITCCWKRGNTKQAGPSRRTDDQIS
jgi:hypothetical protein